MIPRTSRLVLNAPASPAAAAAAPTNMSRTFRMDFATMATATTTTKVAPAKRVSSRTRRLPAKTASEPAWLTGRARVEAYRLLLGSPDVNRGQWVQNCLAFSRPWYGPAAALDDTPCPAIGSKKGLVFNGQKRCEAPVCPDTPSPLFASRIPPPTPMLRSGASPYVSRGVLSPSARKMPPSSTNLLAPFSPGRGLRAPTRFLTRGAGITVEAPDRAGKNDWSSFHQSSWNVPRAQNFTEVTVSVDIPQSEPVSEEIQAPIHSACSSPCCSAGEDDIEDGDGSCDMELEEISSGEVVVISEPAPIEVEVDAQSSPSPLEEKVEICASPIREEMQTETAVAADNHIVVAVAEQVEPQAFPRTVAPPLWDGKTELPVEVINAMAMEHLRWQEEEEPLFDPEGKPWTACRHLTCYRHGRRAMCRARSRILERGDVKYRPRNLAIELEATYGKNWQQLFFTVPPPSVEKTEDDVDFSVW
ncbi:hypothetical protein BCV69DRAFT_294585 [Microstroma glucosiphilum]|uniref:Uncharacterized protein n=1 Tax=Pseudomicrostroma glucosiphilum TaxID=1684307 RepID=A0A316U206_9BASI|nr:hypothetical protein BCV69DRAFT_294585 [Pseudomicrostroma glucosiphilum]PWN19389.1 hypothetical protein BCV69DRAFT_294585 [Pseudomicrostroma glucosiphilum]